MQSVKLARYFLLLYNQCKNYYVTQQQIKLGIANMSYLVCCFWGQKVKCHRLHPFLTAIFPGEPGLVGTRMSPFWILLELRVMEVVSSDNWSYKTWKTPVKSPPPTNQHPTSYRPDALPVAQPTMPGHWREIKCHSQCRKKSGVLASWGTGIRGLIRGMATLLKVTRSY